MDIKNYNKNIKEMLSNMNKTTNYYKKVKNYNKTFVKKYSNPPISKMKSFNNNTNNDNNRFNYYSSKINRFELNLTSDENTKRKNFKVSNQIESIYNELDRIQKTIRKYEKAMLEVDNFYQNMDIVLSQYESMSDSILSTYDCKINK